MFNYVLLYNGKTAHQNTYSLESRYFCPNSTYGPRLLALRISHYGDVQLRERRLRCIPRCIPHDATRSMRYKRGLSDFRFAAIHSSVGTRRGVFRFRVETMPCLHLRDESTNGNAREKRTRE